MIIFATVSFAASALTTSLQSSSTDTIFSGCFFVASVLHFTVVFMFIVTLGHYTPISGAMLLIPNWFEDGFVRIQCKNFH